MNRAVANRVRWAVDWKWLCRREWPANKEPRTICEIGLGPADISMLAALGPRYGARQIAIEPNPEFWPVFGQHDGILRKLHQAAIGRERGTAELVLAGGSSCLQEHAKWQGARGQRLEVPVIPMADVDTGDIDVLNVDCEGAELAVLEGLRSEPRIIGIEIWPHNPDAAALYAWLETRGYVLRITTGPEGETQIWTL